MVARLPHHGYISQQLNGGAHRGAYGTSSEGRVDGTTTPKYPHIKDLRAKAEAEAKDLSAHTPVRLLIIFICPDNALLIDAIQDTNIIETCAAGRDASEFYG